VGYRVIYSNLKLGGGGVCTNVWGGVNMREAQIYIKKQQKTKTITKIGKGGGMLSFNGGGGYLPRGCKNITSGVRARRRC